MTDFSRVNYAVNEGVARITLDRADVRNAQDKAMLYELNDAFDLAAQDDEVKVVVLGANGPHFSSGHDLADRSEMDEFSPVTNWGGFAKPGAETDFCGGAWYGYCGSSDGDMGLRPNCRDQRNHIF